jgi:hypothetical protein
MSFENKTGMLTAWTEGHTQAGDKREPVSDMALQHEDTANQKSFLRNS